MKAKELKLAAASVRGARAAGVQTQAAQKAPAKLAEGERVLERMLDRASSMEPSAPSMGAEGRYYAAAQKASAYAEAVDDLRNALGGA